MKHTRGMNLAKKAIGFREPHASLMSRCTSQEVQDDLWDVTRRLFVMAQKDGVHFTISETSNCQCRHTEDQTIQLSYDQARKIGAWLTRMAEPAPKERG